LENNTMTKEEQKKLAERLRALHRSPPILLLPNCWDPMSARLFEAAGFPAVATTSGGLSWALGYQDGECTPWSEVTGAIARITRLVGIPLSADIEKGYGDDPAAVAASVSDTIAAGAVGINLEDSHSGATNGIRSIEDAVARIHAARDTANASGIPLVINARTDVYQVKTGNAEEMYADVTRRAEAYLAAGADCIYVFGPLDMETAARLAKAIPAPVNIAGRPGMPTAKELERIGIARVSTAGGPATAVLEATSNIARALFDSGDFGSYALTLKRPDIQALFTGRATDTDKPR
jgi:2-methylisocitrate lyase-like PEP mutase family enzyme